MKDLTGKLFITSSDSLYLIKSESYYGKLGEVECSIFNLTYNYGTIYYKSTILEQGRVLNCKLLELLYS